jgi:hypothetical protein
MVKDGLGVGDDGSEARGCDVMAKEVNLRGSKLAFGWVDVEAISSEDREDSFKMAEVFRTGAAENEDVIQVKENKGKISEKGVHEALESLCWLESPKGMKRNSKSPKGVGNSPPISK